jgi:hypothetical protein
MTLVSCKECNHEIGKKVSACPNCGAKISAKWSLKKKILFFFVGVWGIGLLATIYSASTTPLPPRTKTPEQVVREGLNFDFTWTKGGFSTVMLLNATITNSSPYPIKDFVIVCFDSGNSGTTIDKNKRMVYETIAPGDTLKLRGFNMGFIHNQATQAECSITDFLIAPTN